MHGRMAAMRSGLRCFALHSVGLCGLCRSALGTVQRMGRLAVARLLRPVSVRRLVGVLPPLQHGLRLGTVRLESLLRPLAHLFRFTTCMHGSAFRENSPAH